MSPRKTCFERISISTFVQGECASDYEQYHEEFSNGSDKELTMPITSEVSFDAACDSKQAKKKKRGGSINEENDQIDLDEILQENRN